jgi:hypothetical protein
VLSRAEFEGGFAVVGHPEQKGTLQSRTAAQHRPFGGRCAPLGGLPRDWICCANKE